MKKCFVLALVSMILAVPAWSACKEAQAPLLPSPELADINEMLEAQAAVKNYIQDQQVFLSCSRDGFRHNRAIDRMHDIAREFNKRTRRFKAKQASEDMFTELALISY